MKRRKFKMSGTRLRNCIPLDEVLATSEDGSLDDWWIDYDPGTDTCFTYNYRALYPKGEFEV